MEGAFKAHKYVHKYAPPRFPGRYLAAGPANSRDGEVGGVRVPRGRGPLCYVIYGSEATETTGYKGPGWGV